MENPVTVKSKELNEVARQFECEHQENELRTRTVARGLIQRVTQCLRCGAATSKAYSKSDALAQTGGKEPPPFNDELLSDWQTRKEEAFKAVHDKFSFLSVRKDPSRPKSAEWFKQYNEYLTSDHWAHTRNKVLTRANNVCEGCLEKQATDVHHLSYANLGHEFMFQLVALCHDCHERIHNWSRAV